MTDKPKCTHCAAGRAPKFRPDTKEWVHAFMTGNKFTSCICVDKHPEKAK